MSKQSLQVALAALLGATALLIFNLFFKLSTNRVEEWDEARRGISAYEMCQSHDYLVPTYRGQPDYWNSKPPLGLWLTCLSYRMFGENRLSLRLISALSALCTAVVIILLAVIEGAPRGGIISILVLATTPPYLFEHSARAGEYDALLALLIALEILILKYMKEGSQRMVALGLLFGAIFLLKSLALIIPAVILVFFLIWTGWTLRGIAIGLLKIFLIATLPVAIWAIFRFQRDGWRFFEAMYRNDLVARAVSKVEGHEKGVFWYIQRYLKANFIWNLYLLCLLRATGWSRLRIFINNYKFYLCWFVVPILIGTLVQTKIAWYINPSYPAVALLVGLLFHSLEGTTRRAMSGIFLAALIVSQSFIVRKILQRERPSKEEAVTSNVALPRSQAIFSDEWTQTALYIATVEKKLTCDDVTGVEDFRTRAPHAAYLISRSVTDLPEFEIISKAGDWKLLKRP